VARFPRARETLTPSSTIGLLAIYDIGGRLGPERLGSGAFRGVHRALGLAVAIRIARVRLLSRLQSET
jgi:hypothetical protein